MQASYRKDASNQGASAILGLVVNVLTMYLDMRALEESHRILQNQEASAILGLLVNVLTLQMRPNVVLMIFDIP